MRIIKFFITVVLLFVACACSNGTTAKPPSIHKINNFSKIETIHDMLPSVSEGYKWAVYRNSAFLKPNGWFEKEKIDVSGNYAIGTIAISPENFLETNLFEHGFTLQIFPNFKTQNGVVPSIGAIKFIKQVVDQKDKKDALMFEVNDTAVGKSFIFRYRDQFEEKTTIIVHKLFVANDITDSLHIFTYECPESTWQNNWKTFGVPIMEKLIVVPTLSAT